MQRLYADGAYGGKRARTIESAHALVVEVVRRPGNGAIGALQTALALPERGAGFTILPKRWVVERTHAWIERWRRTLMHHDRKLSVAAAWVWLANARILLNRLA